MAEDINKNNDNEKVLIEVYKDAISPAAKEVGKMVSLPFQAINAALSGARIWVAEKQYNYDRTLKLLAKKMEDIPTDNISSPENYIAVPALQQISYCYDSDELRDMYANLLASSMQKDKKWKVHPSFVEIIKQLLLDEAKLIKYLATKEVAATLTLRAVDEDETGIDILKNYSLVGYEAGCDSPKSIGVYINNLSRLGLIINYTGIRYLTDKELYERIKCDNFMKMHVDKILKRNAQNKPNYEEGYIQLSDLGNNFCNICIR